MPPTELWARRIGVAMGVVGLVLLDAGILFGASGVSTSGAILLLSRWKPWRIVTNPR